MKQLNLLIVFLLLVFAIPSFGQSVLDKGNYQLGGSFKYNYSETKYLGYKDKVVRLDLAPEFSYFIIDNLLIGGTVSYQHHTFIYSDASSSDNSLGVGPSIKYYFRISKIIPFIGTSFLFEKYLKSYTGYQWNIDAGFDFFLAKSLALEPFVSYSYENRNKSNSINSNFSTGIRLSYFITK